MSSDDSASHAISIPSQSKGLRASAAARRSRYKARLERTDSSDAGPSSSVGSSQSSWDNDNGGTALTTKAQQKAPVRTPISSTSTPSHIHRQDNSKRITKQQRPVTPSSSPPSRMPSTLAHPHNSPLGPSMAASTSYKSINLSSGHHDDSEPPRLICYTKHSQGFTWNDELFLPGYLLSRYGGSSYNRRRRNRFGGSAEDDYDEDDDDDIMDSNDPERCPITEIFVTDEEAADMLP